MRINGENTCEALRIVCGMCYVINMSQNKMLQLLAAVVSYRLQAQGLQQALYFMKAVDASGG